jgi:hypothetical protein
VVDMAQKLSYGDIMATGRFEQSDDPEYPFQCPSCNSYLDAGAIEVEPSGWCNHCIELEQVFAERGYWG